MKQLVLKMIAIFVTTAIAGCGESGSLNRVKPKASGSVDDAPVKIELDPTDKRVIDLVAWLKSNGVTLEYSSRAEGSGHWKVVEPRTTDEYDVVFYIGSFPASANEQQMRLALDVNLAYMLNARAHLAMSYAEIRGTSPDAQIPSSDAAALPKLNGIPITTATEKLFAKYKAR